MQALFVYVFIRFYSVVLLRALTTVVSINSLAKVKHDDTLAITIALLPIVHTIYIPGAAAPDSRDRCSINYLTVPNSSHLRHCACTISQSLVRRCLFNIYFFGYGYV